MWLCSASCASLSLFLCVCVSKWVSLRMYLFFVLFISVYSQTEILNIFGRMLPSQGQLFSLLGLVYFIGIYKHVCVCKSAVDYLRVLLLPAFFFFFFGYIYITNIPKIEIWSACKRIYKIALIERLHIETERFCFCIHKLFLEIWSMHTQHTQTHRALAINRNC